ncbi:SDR family NAD(P)-dependent oxidoreductase [Vibrio sp. FNV 38]|nr:SDR family NAD(P)-dependent oxidoreductase [Vibrio sp. FNV 38]
MTILIIGGSGGIGRALVEYYVHQGEKVYATYFQNKPHASQVSLSLEHLSLEHSSHAHSSNASSPKVRWILCDVTNEQSIVELAQHVPEVDILINCVGLLHDDSHRPEKSIRELDTNFFLRNIERNTLPTLLLAKHFAPHFKGKRPTSFVSLSAKVGSIEDNQLGGWVSYRASKAALNMCLKTLAIEWKVSLPHCCVFAFHPGTIDTSLSAPFRARIPIGQRHSPDWLATNLAMLITSLNSTDSGKFYDYSGRILPW